MNKLNIDGHTALARAAELMHKGCLDVLIKAGASVNMKLGDGETILSCAMRKKFGFGEPYEHLVVRPQCFQLLLEAGADVNIPFRDGRTPLMHAVSRPTIIEREDLVKPLLRYGADVNIVDKDLATPLIFLASLVNKKCILRFL